MAFSRTVTSRTGPQRGPGGPAAAGGWYPVARSEDVGTTPVPVGADGRAYVVVRLRSGAEVTALPARCPHRLVPLATATVVDGRLQCGYHGWQFNSEGRCVGIPSLGCRRDTAAACRPHRSVVGGGTRRLGVAGAGPHTRR